MADIDGTQCFPEYLYEAVDGENGGQGDKDADSDEQGSLDFGGGAGRSRSLADSGRVTEDGKYRVREAVTDEALRRFRVAYSDEKINKKELFYYVYGLLHSEDYRQRYASNLTKELPRIPAVRQFADFRAFAEAGKALAKLHLGFDTAKPYSARIEFAKKRTTLTDEDYRVVKMRFGRPQGGGDDNESGEVQEKWDRTTIHYNETIVVHDIPLDAYDYIVNGKSAIDWVMERQSVTTDKTTGITNDANAWAAEQRNAKYPLELLLRVITVSLETMKIVRALPALKV
jgi:predicted helicase